MAEGAGVEQGPSALHEWLNAQPGKDLASHRSAHVAGTQAVLVRPSGPCYAKYSPEARREEQSGRKRSEPLALLQCWPHNSCYHAEEGTKGPSGRRGGSWQAGRKYVPSSVCWEMTGALAGIPYLQDPYDFRHHGGQTPGGVEARSILQGRERHLTAHPCSHFPLLSPVSPPDISAECKVIYKSQSEFLKKRRLAFGTGG